MHRYLKTAVVVSALGLLGTAQLEPALAAGPRTSPPAVPSPPAPPDVSAIPAPPVPPGTPDSPEVEHLKSQLEATRAQLEQMQKQFEQLNQHLQQTSRQLEQLQPGSSLPVPSGESDGEAPGIAEAVREAMEEARQATEEARQAQEEAQREAQEARSEALRNAIEAREEAARQLAEVAREAARGTAEQQQEYRQQLREAQRALRDAEREARRARREAGQGDIIGESETRNGERVAFGSSTVVKDGETVPELVVLKGDGEVYGEVKGDAVVMAGDLIIHKGGRVGGDGVVLGGKVRIEEGGKLEGEQVQVAAGQLLPRVVTDHGTVRLTYKDHHEDGADADSEPEEDDGPSVWSRFRNGIILYLLLVAGGLLSLTFAPLRMRNITSTLERRTLASGIVGVVALFALIPMTLVLVVTLIGIPLVPLVYGGLLLSGMMGVTAIGQVLGRRLPLRDGPRTAGGILLWGLAIFVLATRLPYLGILVGIAGALVGLGAVLLSRFGDREDLT